MHDNADSTNLHIKARDEPPLVPHLHRPYGVLGQDVLAAQGDREVAELLGVGEHSEVVLGGGGEQGHDDGHLKVSQSECKISRYVKT